MHIIGMRQSRKSPCLDGEGDWVDCGNDARLNIASDTTIACWVRVCTFDKPRKTNHH